MVNKKILFGIIAAVLLILDQVTKHLAETRVILKDFGWFAINLVHNTGASFGIFKGMNFYLIIFSVIVFVLIIKYYKKISPEFSIFLLFVMIGLVGNLIDRIRYGYVVDFFDLKWFPVFNVADSLITIGIIGLIIKEIITEFNKKKTTS